MNRQTLVARAVTLLGGLGLLFAMPMCAAPDAQPGPETNGSSSSSSSSSSSGEADGGPDVVTEPVAGDPAWREGYGDSANDQKVFDVALESSTNSLVTTFGFISSITIAGVNGDAPFMSGAGVQNILIVKSDVATGNAVWATPIYDNAEMVRSTVEIDSKSNVIVAGGFGGTIQIQDIPSVTSAGVYDAFITKLDPTGKPLWLRTFGVAQEDYVTDVATDADGNIVVVGFAASNNIDFGDGKTIPSLANHDIFVAKYDPDGKLMWAQRAGSAGPTVGPGQFNWREPTATVAVSPVDGSIIVGGAYQGNLNFPPLEIPGVLNEEDGFVVKLDAKGKGLWHFEFGGTNGAQRVRSVALGANGEVYFTGAIQGNILLGTETLKSYKGTKDLIVAKLDNMGMRQWVRMYGGLGDQLGTKVLVDDNAHLFVGGSFTGSLDFFDNGSLINTTKDQGFIPTDIFVSKFKDDGTPVWAHGFGDANPQVLLGIQTIEGAALWKDSMDKAFVTFGGINSGSIDFGGVLTTLQTVGFEDAYLMTITY